VNTAGGGTVSYGYDLAGNTTKVTDPQGTDTHDYDPANVLTQTTYPTSSGTAKQLYTTDDKGRRTDTWLAATANSDPTKDPTAWQARQHLDYDSAGKVTRVRAWADSTNQQAVVDITYCYTAGVTAGADCSATNTANDRDKIQWSKDNLTGQTTTYGYTNPDGTTSNRLTGITQSGGSNPTNWAFTYNSAGSRTEAKATNAATGAVKSDQKLTYNAAGQITTTGYQYDATGNLTAAPGETFTYNGAQQMTKSVKDGVTTTYEYAGADMNKMLSQSTDGGAEYDYTYGTTDRQGVPVLTARTVAGTGTASIITDPSTGQPLNLRTTDGVTSLYVADGTGNPAAAIADTGATAYTVSHDAYGAENVTAGGTSVQWKQNPYGFKAGLRSSSTDTGLTKFGYRWQDANTGAWIQRDTLDAPLDPRNANRYAFVGDPINSSDPTGRYDLAGAAGDVANFTGAGAGIGGLIGCGVGLVAAGAGCVPAGGAGLVIGGVVGTAFGLGYAVGNSLAGGYN